MSNAGPGRREVAHRIFAAEYDDASLEYAESDEERAPNYVVLPSGGRVNRLFVVGVLTAVEQVNEDTVRARIADPTGAFVVYAGQYQPDELAALQSMESPAFVAVTGKANTFSPEGSDRVLTSVRPESVTEVDAETRDRWVVASAEHTLARVQTAADALGREERGDELRAALLRDGVEPGLAEGIAKAIDHYGTTADYLGALRDLAFQALEVVAGDRSEVESLERSPADGDGTVSAADLAGLLDEEQLGATRAAGDVDPETLLAEESGDGEDAAAEEPGAGTESASGASETAESAAEGATETTSEETETEATDEETEAEPSSSEEVEPVTSESAVEQTAEEAEVAAEGGGGSAEETDASGAEPETSEEAVQETAADAEAAADAREVTGGEGTEEAEEAGEAEKAEEGAEESEADDERYEVDEAEREQIEEEHGVEFQSGTEVGPAGEAGIETEESTPEDVEEAEAESEDEVAGTTSDSDEAPEEADEEGADDESESAEDVDLESVLLDEMTALNDGDGADREQLVDAVADETGADAEAIDDAIDDLLMSGQCYEPSEGTLKPI